MTAPADVEELLRLVDTDPKRVLVETDSPGDIRPLGPDARAGRHRARALALAHLERVDEAVTEIERALRCRGTSEAATGGVEMTAGALLVWAGRTTEGLALLQSAAGRPAVTSEAGVQLGAALYRLGRYRDALGALEAARPGLASAPPEWRSRLETNLGLTLAALGEIDAATAAIERAIAFDTEAGHDQGVANGYHNLGWVASVAGDLPAAFRYYSLAAETLAGPAEPWRDRAEALLSAGFLAEAAAAAGAAADQLARSGHLAAAAEARIKLAQALLLDGRWSSAEEAATAAEADFESQGRPGWALYARLLVRQARIGVDLGAVEVEEMLALAEDLDERGFASAAQEARIWAVTAAVAQGRAREFIDLARRLVGPSLRPRLAPAAWLARAEVEEAMGRRSAAWRMVGRGLAAAEVMVAALGANEARTYMARSMDGLVALGSRLVPPDGPPRARFDWVERTRATAVRLPRVGSGPDSDTSTLVAELRVLERSIEALPPGPDLERARRHRARLERDLRNWARAQRGDGARAAAVSADAVLSALGDDEAVLSLSMVGDDLAGVLLHRGRARRLTMGSHGAVVAAQAQLLRSLSRLTRRIDPELASVVRQDLEALSVGWPDLPTTADVIVVSPPPELASVPWSMLPGFRGRSVGAVPSVTAAISAPTGPFGSVAAVAGDGLTHALSEVAVVASAYGQDPLRGSDPPTVLEHLGRCDAAHFACHGSFRSDSPMFSSLQLGDGSLYLHELERLASPPRLVVLSACDLGSSSVVGRTEGLGPVSALLAAGVTTVIASPVLVPDHPAVGEVFGRFHTLLRRGMRPADALAEARSVVDPDDPVAVAIGAIQCHGRW